MVIASLYPLVDSQDESTPTFDWEFIRALQHNDGESSHDYYVFFPHGHHPRDMTSVGENVHIKSTIELTDFFQEYHVDVWHDFGYTSASHLSYLRCLSSQDFPITVKVTPEFLTQAQLTTYRALSNSDALICSNSAVHKLLEEVYAQYGQPITQQDPGPQIYTIPHGVKPERIDKDKKRDARYLLHLPEQMTIILCGGDFSPNDSMDLLPLLRAFQTIAANHKDLLLIVSGSDKYGYADRVAEFLENSPIQRRVLLRPNIGESAQLLLLAAADIFISPSDAVYRDNQLQVLEAMARGIPVIATDDECDYIHHGKNGFRLKRECIPMSYNALSPYFPFIPHHIQSLIVSQGIAIDVQQIVEYLALLIEDPSLRKTFGKAAVQYVSEHRLFETSVAKYETLWYNLHEKGSSVQPQIPILENQVNDGWLPLLLSPISQTIDEITPMQITSYGETLLETQNLVIYEEMSEVIFPPIIFEILNLSRTITCLSDITHSLLQLSDPEDAKDLVPNIAYHAMWCIKQGLIIPKQNDTVSMSTSNAERNN